VETTWEVKAVYLSDSKLKLHIRCPVLTVCRSFLENAYVEYVQICV
jgi:hypothetical protein